MGSNPTPSAFFGNHLPVQISPPAPFNLKLKNLMFHLFCMTSPKIIELYPEPIRRGRVEYELAGANYVLEECIAQIKPIVDEAIKIYQKRHPNATTRDGVVRPVVEWPNSIQTEMEHYIKKQEIWRHPVYRIVADQYPSLLDNRSFDQIVRAITIPWWNTTVENLDYSRYVSGGRLKVGISSMHTYMTQILRAKPESLIPLGKMDSVSVSVMAFTKREDSKRKFAIGRRSGHFEPDTLMPVAGSVKRLGNDPIFNTAEYECKNELGLTSDECGSDKMAIVAKVFDKELSRNSLFDFTADANLSPQQICERWERGAKGRGQHGGWIFVEDDPREIKLFLEDTAFRDPNEPNFLLNPARLTINAYAKFAYPNFEYVL